VYKYYNATDRQTAWNLVRRDDIKYTNNYSRMSFCSCFLYVICALLILLVILTWISHKRQTPVQTYSLSNRTQTMKHKLSALKLALRVT